MEELLQLQDIDRVVHAIFEDKIPFNRLLGIKVLSVDGTQTRLRFDMHDELVGHFVHKYLHGGVTSAAALPTGSIATGLSPSGSRSRVARTRRKLPGPRGRCPFTG